MFEEDHAPVTLSEIYQQASSCQRTVELAQESSRRFEPFTSLDITTLIASQPAIGNPITEVLRPALYAHIGHLLANWRAAARNLNQNAPRHLARMVLLNIE